MKKTKVAVVVGHSVVKQGASNPTCGMTEFNFNRVIGMGLLAKDIADVEIQLVYRKSYWALPGRIDAMEPDFIISLHCNAFNTKATGKETLFSGSRRGRVLAECMHDNICLCNADRGIKAVSREDRGGHLLHETKAPCVIVEPFFIDNAEYFMVNPVVLIDQYAAGIMNAVREFSK